MCGVEALLVKLLCIVSEKYGKNNEGGATRACGWLGSSRSRVDVGC